jgi:uncharacterized protein YbaR (Trm112 family)
MADILFKKESGPRNTFFPLKVRTMSPWPVPYGMVIVSSFTVCDNKLSGVFTITAKESICCPLCRGELFYHDNKRRTVKNLLGEIRHFLLRRLRCSRCKKLHTELPSIIQPYRHYSSDAIQSVLDGSEAGADCVADNSTIRRWKTEFIQAEPDIGQRLASVHAQMDDEKPPISDTVHILDKIKSRIKRWLACVMELLINNGHKIFTQFAFRPFSSPDRVRSESKKETERGKKDDKTTKNSS